MVLNGFQIVVTLEVEEDEPVADVSFRGIQIAAVRASGVKLYDSETSVPAEGLIAALVKARSDITSYR